MPEALLTAAEVAELLKLHVETVYALIAKAGLPAAKIGGQWRFEEARLRAWIEAHSANRARPAPTPTHTRDAPAGDAP